MPENVRSPASDRDKIDPPNAKVVAEMPDDDEMQKKLEEMKQNDGYPGSCGI